MNRKLTLGLLLVWIGLVLVTAGMLNLTGRPANAATAAPAADAPAFVAGTDPAYLQQNLIRLHVVANSDSEADQALKRTVRDAILAEVTPLFAGARTREAAEAAIAKAIPQIEAVAARVIREQGQTYGVKAEIGAFDFPARFYGELFVPAGRYSALRVTIGAAKGANWWCVLFPPLCFTDWSTGVVLEPKPGSGGKETVTVARVAVLDWAKQKLAQKAAQRRVPR